MSATLPLESIRVASPCSVSWDAMTGDDRKRFCGQCSRHVFNLAGMQREEAERLVGAAAQAGERLCVQLFIRADGTVLTADCPVGLRAARRKLAAIGAALTGLAGLVAGAVGLGAAEGREEPRTWFAPAQPPIRVVRGDMVAPRPRATPAPVATQGRS